ncbi:Uncharacterised protein [Budvicia aquatica]|uniref:Uncharacterized protein n=1 Tax=Budvicia aquatica TaxID=82979 RepID=A0A484ZHS1_9GAMM|nr:Uncharacterised protein [Budvicia aquatica]
MIVTNVNDYQETVYLSAQMKELIGKALAITGLKSG